MHGVITDRSVFASGRIHIEGKRTGGGVIIARSVIDKAQGADTSIVVAGGVGEKRRVAKTGVINARSSRLPCIEAIIGVAVGGGRCSGSEGQIHRGYDRKRDWEAAVTRQA